MITHNGKQVSIAMRNRKAINLIARNGKAMWDAWEYGNTYITQAAKAVILAEYGKVVWSDVRDYAKAHPAIVPFINQDPHLAASISPNSNKERWLKKEVKANYFDLGIILHGESTGVRVSYKLEATNLGQDVSIFGARSGYGNNDYSINFGAWGFGTFYIGYNTCHSEPKVPTDTNKHIVTINKGLVSVDDWSKDYGVQSFSTPVTARLFDNANGAHPCSPLCLIDKCEMWENDVPSHTFVPYRDPSTGEMELLDLVTLTLATRVGTFTEVIEDRP